EVSPASRLRGGRDEAPGPAGRSPTDLSRMAPRLHAKGRARVAGDRIVDSCATVGDLLSAFESVRPAPQESEARRPQWAQEAASGRGARRRAAVESGACLPATRRTDSLRRSAPSHP